MDLHFGLITEVNWVLLLLLPALVYFLSCIDKCVAWLVSCFSKHSAEEFTLTSEAKTLKKEMGQLSIVNDFVKYSKLQRRFNKVSDQLEKLGQARDQVCWKRVGTLQRISHILAALFSFYIVYAYSGSHPVFVLKPNVLFPLNYFMGFLCNVPGGISIWFWLVFSQATFCVFGL